MPRGLLRRGVCDRRMQGQWNHDEAYYRCRHPQEYTLANTIDHPRNVYLAERGVLPRLDDWLAQAFAPTRLETTIDQLYEAQDNQPSTTDDADAVVADCDDKLARYRQALEAGADPALVAVWTAGIQARKAEALAQQRSRRRQDRRNQPASLTASCLVAGWPSVDHRAARSLEEPCRDHGR